MKRYGGLLLALGLAAGCSGGGSGSHSLPQPPGGGGTTGQSHTVLKLKIPAPKKATGHLRSPKFIAPQTAGMSVAVTPSGGKTVNTYLDLSPTSPLCVNNPDGSRTCNAPIAAPPGSDTFVFATFDGPPPSGSCNAGVCTSPPTGNQLGGVTFTQTINAGSNNTLNVAIGGLIASMSMLPVDWSVDGGRPQEWYLGLSAFDKDGNLIIAGGTSDQSQYDNGPVTVSEVETNGTGHTGLSVFEYPATPMPSGGSTSVQVTQSVQQIDTNYDGNGNTNNPSAPYYVTFSAQTADKAASATAYFSPIYFSTTSLTQAAYGEDTVNELPNLTFYNDGTGGGTATLTLNTFTPSIISPNPYYWNVTEEPSGSGGNTCSVVSSVSPQPNPTLIPSSGTSSQVAFTFGQVNNGGVFAQCRVDYQNYLGPTPPQPTPQQSPGSSPGPGTVELELTNSASPPPFAPKAQSHNPSPRYHLMKMRRDAPSAGVRPVSGQRSVGTVIRPRQQIGPHLAGYGKIKHVVVIMQENRSFNYFFGGGSGYIGATCGAGNAACPAVTPFPGATTAVSGVGLLPANPGGNPNTPGATPTTYPLKIVPIEDGITPSHDYSDYLHDCNFNNYPPSPPPYVCQNNGWNSQTYKLIRPGASPPPLGYNFDIAPGNEAQNYRLMAAAYTLPDQLFESNGGASFISHQYMVSGQAEDTLGNPPGFPWGCDSPPGSFEVQIQPNGQINPFGPFPCYDYPNVATLADARGVSWKYYAPDIISGGDGRSWSVMEAFRYIRYGADWLTNVISPETTILSDLTGPSPTLPNITYVVPALIDSDHPKSVANCGPYWITALVNAIGKSPNWDSTAIFIMWDDWGGQYDPALPPRLDWEGLGYRIPAIVISPYAKKHYVSHVQYEVASTLKFIEETFNLGSLGQADARAGDLTDAFDFTQTPSSFTPFPTPSFPPSVIPPLTGCPVTPSDFVRFGKAHRHWTVDQAPDDD